MEDMAKNEIDPRFFLPPGIVDLNYKDDVEASSDTPIEDNPEVQLVDPVWQLPSELDDEVTTGGEAEGTLLPPNAITLVSQNVRVNSGGSVVVDVVIDVETTPGAANFEVRMTK